MQNSFITIRYEDFVDTPKNVLYDILDYINEKKNLDFINLNTVQLKPTHSVGGSPSRHNTGQITLQADEKWKKKLPEKISKIVDFWGKPSLRKYGY